MTMRAKRYQNSAALLIFMRRTTIPHFSFFIQAELSNVIMGQHAPRAAKHRWVLRLYME